LVSQGQRIGPDLWPQRQTTAVCPEEKELLLLTFYLNGGLHAVSIEKPSEQMTNFSAVFEN